MQRLSHRTNKQNSSWLFWAIRSLGTVLLAVFLICFGPSLDQGKKDSLGGYAFARGGDSGGDDNSGSDSGGDDDGDSDDSGGDDSSGDDGDDDDSGSDDSGDDDGDDDGDSDDSGNDDSGDDDDSGSNSSDDDHDGNHDHNDDDLSGDRRSGHAGEAEDDSFDRRRGADGLEDDGIHQHRSGQIDDVRRAGDDSRNRNRRLLTPESSPGSVDDSRRGQAEAGDDNGGQRQLRGLGVIDDLSEVSPEEESSLLGNWQN